MASAYGAFISYRHVEPDASVAAGLHASLERFRTPQSLRRRGIAPTLGQVYIDDGEAAAGSLPEILSAALRASAALIVICSRETPKSPWVDEEIEEFAHIHGASARIFALLIDGSVDDACPAALQRILHESGITEGGNAPRAPVVISTLPVRRRFRREPQWRLTSVAQTLAAHLLKCDTTVLSAAVAERGRRRRLQSLVAAAAILASVAVLTWRANTTTTWSLTERRRVLTGALDWSILTDVAGTIQGSTALEGVWAWDPTTGATRRVPERVFPIRSGRFVLETRGNAWWLRAANAEGEWQIPGATDPTSIPFVDPQGRYLMTPHNDDTRLRLRIFSIEPFAEVSTVDLGTLSEPTPTDRELNVPQSREMTLAANAATVWQSVRVVGGHLLASNAAEPTRPLLRRLPEGTAIAPLIRDDQKAAFLIAVDRARDRLLLAVGDTALREVCLWDIDPVRARGCADISGDPDLDIEGGTFSSAGDTIWLPAFDNRLVVVRTSAMTLLERVRPPDQYRVADQPDTPDTTRDHEQWVFWTRDSRTWASPMISGYAPQPVSVIDIPSIRQISFAEQKNRLIVRYDRRVDLVEPGTWRVVTSIASSEGWVDARPSVEGTALSAQSVEGRMVVASLDDGRELARFEGVGGREHRVWVGTDCGLFRVLSGRGEALTFQEGQLHFGRWFSPRATCVSSPVVNGES